MKLKQIQLDVRTREYVSATVSRIEKSMKNWDGTLTEAAQDLIQASAMARQYLSAVDEQYQDAQSRAASLAEFEIAYDMVASQLEAEPIAEPEPIVDQSGGLMPKLFAGAAASIAEIAEAKDSLTWAKAKIAEAKDSLTERMQKLEEAGRQRHKRVQSTFHGGLDLDYHWYEDAHQEQESCDLVCVSSEEDEQQGPEQFPALQYKEGHRWWCAERCAELPELSPGLTWKGGDEGSEFVVHAIEDQEEAHEEGHAIEKKLIKIKAKATCHREEAMYCHICHMKELIK